MTQSSSPSPFFCSAARAFAACSRCSARYSTSRPANCRSAWMAAFLSGPPVIVCISSWITRSTWLTIFRVCSASTRLACPPLGQLPRLARQLDRPFDRRHFLLVVLQLSDLGGQLSARLGVLKRWARGGVWIAGAAPFLCQRRRRLGRLKPPAPRGSVLSLPAVP